MAFFLAEHRLTADESDLSHSTAFRGHFKTPLKINNHSLFSCGRQKNGCEARFCAEAGHFFRWVTAKTRVPMCPLQSYATLSRDEI